MTETNSKAKEMGIKAQKKILSSMASKNMAKFFIDDTTASLLDNVYKLIKCYVLMYLFSLKILNN